MVDRDREVGDEHDDEQYDDEQYDDEQYAEDDEDFDDEDYVEDVDEYDEGDERLDGHDGDGELPRATAVAAIRSAMRLVGELTGRRPEGVVSMAPVDGGGWCVGVEVVETRRIPDSADILAVYEATVDGDLELTGFRRTRRYTRGQVDAR